MRPEEIELPGAVVAVTGAGRGIGRATAQAFAARGARVALGDLDPEAAADAAAGIGPGAQAFALDVTSKTSFRQFLEAVSAGLGPVDVLVNNAGIMPIAPFLDESDETAAAILDVNVHGPIFGLKLVLPGMIERGRGHVVNVASYAGKFEIPGLATYSASKFALVGLTAAVARELESTGVTVTAVLPSAVETELASGVPFPFARIAKVRPEHVAAAIVASVRDRPREVAVPGWLAAAEPLSALIPGPAERLIRRALGDDRALTKLDPMQRADYIERVARQTRERQPAPE